MSVRGKKKKKKMTNVDLEKESDLGTAAHVCNSSTREGETGRQLRVRGQPGLQSDFHAQRGL